MKRFTPLQISTTTVTAALERPFNVIDVAKYMPLDDTILGVKLAYAGGSSVIIRGVAKVSKKKDILNQVSFVIRLPFSDGRTMLVNCKLFHNGAIVITGTRSLDEAKRTANILFEKLHRFAGVKMISCIDKEDYICSFDHVLFSTKGEIIGWRLTDTLRKVGKSPTLFLKEEYVVLDSLHLDSEDGQEIKYPVFVSHKWKANSKTIYTLDGDAIGTRQLQFYSDLNKKHFDVKLGYIYSGLQNKIIGKEELDMEEDYLQKLTECETSRRNILKSRLVLHSFDAYSTWHRKSAPEKDIYLEEDNFTVQMINTYFQAPFSIYRLKLHKTFKDYDFESRYDSCGNAAQNLRFHYDKETLKDKSRMGKCPNREYCTCKKISVSCFSSGKMNITGLGTIEQGYVVYEFLKDFFMEHKEEIQQRGNSPVSPLLLASPIGTRI